MKRFAELFIALDRTTKTNEKIAALSSYFVNAPKRDAAWALFFLTGNTITRPASTRTLRSWVAEATNVPLWLLEESYHVVGDLAETFALILPSREEGSEITLSELVENGLRPLLKQPEADRREPLFRLWSSLDSHQSFLFVKLITGAMRVGVQRTSIARALAQVCDVPQHAIEHRMMGGIQPTPDFLESMLRPGDTQAEPGQPYPLCLAHPIQGDLESLGEPTEWQAEWKWDGIRAEAIRRKGEVLLWSRGEEVINDSFPEIANACIDIPDGTVIDGEILGWREGKPLPFGDLQRRLGRKKVGSKLMSEVPVRFLAYDILEVSGEDIRNKALAERRGILELSLRHVRSAEIGISPLLHFTTWNELRSIHQLSRQMQAEGCMLKRLNSPYGVGRRRGYWWKWKVEPHTCDAVLVYAQRGHGRRAGLFTDFTFAVWKNDELVPVAKAYSGLTDDEFIEVNRFIRKHTIERFGPVVTVEPGLVFELAFDDIRLSRRHKAGIALRFPRISRWRSDKLPKDADSVSTLQGLLPTP